MLWFPLTLFSRPSWSLAVVLLASVVSVANAATLSGEVVAIADGDTVTVLDASKTQHKVRLSGIDAPEKGQPFGDKSRQHLAALLFRRDVVVRWHKSDRYGRLVGKVMVATTDASLWQVRAGMAWHYVAYAKEQAAEDRQSYAEAEAEARRIRRGLWQDANPTPPWEHRKSKKRRAAGLGLTTHSSDTRGLPPQMWGAEPLPTRHYSL